MSGDHPTLPENQRPVSGTAAGVPYLALPPTAVDARPAGPTRVIVAWPGFDPPRTASALAAAMPMTGVPTWRVYLEPPGERPEGLGSGALLETAGIEAYGAAVERAVDELPAVLDEIRREFGIEEGPVGLAGFSFGASAALLALARGEVPVTAVALVTPVVSPLRTVRSLELRTGRERAWSDGATALAERLDLTAHAREIASRDAAVLLIAGAHDPMVEPDDINRLRDLLREHGVRAVEAATFRMGHALASEPGTTAEPPTTEAVRVDGVLNDWFRERLADVTEPPEAPEHSPGADLEDLRQAGEPHAPDAPDHGSPQSPGSESHATEPALEPVPQPTARQEDPVESRPESGHGGSLVPATASEPGADAPPGGPAELTSPALIPSRGHVRTPMGEAPRAHVPEPRTPLNH